MDGKTMDIVAENIGKLKELFPEASPKARLSGGAVKGDEQDDENNGT